MQSVCPEKDCRTCAKPNVCIENIAGDIEEGTRQGRIYRQTRERPGAGKACGPLPGHGGKSRDHFPSICPPNDPVPTSVSPTDRPIRMPETRPPRVRPAGDPGHGAAGDAESDEDEAVKDALLALQLLHAATQVCTRRAAAPTRRRPAPGARATG